MRGPKTCSFFRQALGLWFLGGFLAITPIFVHAQSQITVKVESPTGGFVPKVTVMARRIDPRSKAILQTFIGRAIATNTFLVERLRKGSYEFYACDDTLTYEPAVSDDLALGDNDSKKIPTLVLGDQSKTVPWEHDPPGTSVCLVHKQTACEAPRVIGQARKKDGSETGSLSIPLFQEHFEVLRQACKQSSSGTIGALEGIPKLDQNAAR